MKNQLYYLALATAFSVSAQIPRGEMHPVHFEKTQCITDSQRQEVRQQIALNKAQILKNDPTAFQHKGSSPLFIFPIRAKSGFNDYGYYTVNNYVDHDATPNGNLLDYECGQRTYDWATGNHEGTDYVLWPYPWKRMQEELMEVVAAAPGIIIDKRDGNFDLNCVNNGNPNWNGIIIEHSDGSQAWYWHFKDGAITAKNIGDSVAEGEYLGAAGSSGSSTVPHLHFEIYDASNNLIDPYEGPCNNMNADSWWAEQPEYFVPTINRLSTHYTQTFDSDCGIVENTYEELNFEPGDELVFRIFYRDIQTNSETHIIFRKPDGTVLYDWVFTSTWEFYPQAWGQWNFNVDASWPDGVYNIEVEFGGNSYETIFGVNTNLGMEDAQATNFSVYPNPASNEITLQANFSMEKVALFDLLGRKLVSLENQTDTTLSISLENIPQGLYLLQVESEGKIFTQKIIKK